MSAPTVLIVGGRGQLGRELVDVFEEGGYRVIVAGREDCDLESEDAVLRCVISAKPALVINTAAFHKTEECERDVKKSFSVNAFGAHAIARAAASVHAPIIFISTDYVFGGEHDVYTEQDLPHPLNVYGASKYAGEILTMLANPQTFVIRTSWLFGQYPCSKGPNFVSGVLSKARVQKEIPVVNDQFGSPTCATDAAQVIKKLVDVRAPWGVYHVANTGMCSWYEFAGAVLEYAGIRNVKFIPTKTPDVSATVRRPMRSALVSTRLSAVGIPSLRPWQEALKEYISHGNI